MLFENTQLLIAALLWSKNRQKHVVAAVCWGRIDFTLVII